jgi:hypothetical protein
MKPIPLLLGLAMLLPGSALYAQSVARYLPVTRTTGITYSSIATTGSSFSAWRNGTSTDDNRSAATPIGFTFYYDGQAFTQLSVSTNGFIDLSASAAIGNGIGAFGYSNTQFSATSGTLLAIAPMYEELITAGNPGTQASLDASLKHELSGSAPNRVLTVEWIALEVHEDTAPSLNFQVKLHESSGVIEFIYGTMTAGAGVYSYTTGINGPAISAVPAASELLTLQFADSDSFSATPQNALSVIPESNTMLSLVPEENVTPAQPRNLSFEELTQSSFNVVWADSSTTETFFVVERSTEDGPYEGVGNVPSNSVGGQGTAYSIAQAGLSPGTMYAYRITANNEASAPSGYLEGSQTTDPPGELVSVASGNWSEPSTWLYGLVPSRSDDVVISDGHTVIIDTSASCWDLTIGQGNSGVLEFDPISARALTVGHDVRIQAGGEFRTASSGSTVTSHLLLVSGGLVNDGTLDFSTNADQAGASIRFISSDDVSFTGAGPTTDVRFVTVNKGTSRTPLLLITPGHLSVRGDTTDVAGFITLVSGTVQLGGTFSLTNRIFTTASYVIPVTSGLWLNNPNVVVAGQNGSPTNNGQIRITQGTFFVGTAAGNTMGASAGAEFVIEGGAFTFAGRLGTASAVTYNQSGGVVSVATMGNTSSGVASFDLSSTTTNYVMSGGTIVLVQPSTAPSTRLDYKISSTVTSLTGGTLQIGNGATASDALFNIVGPLPGLVVDNGSSGRRVVLFAGTPQTKVFVNTSILPGATLDLGGFSLYQLGAAFTNDGTLVGSTAGSRIRFQGAAGPQTYAGSGAVQGALDGLIVDNLAGVTISAGIPANLPVLRVDLLRGLLGNSNRITLGNGGATSAVTQIGTAGLAVTAGSYDQAPVFNPGTAGCSVLYMEENSHRTAGFEIPPGRSIAGLTIANPNGVTLSGGGLTVTAGLTLNSGVLATSAGDLLTLANSVANPAGGSAQSYVDGPLAIEFNVASPTDRAFAIGKSGAFRPLVLKQVDTGGVSRIFTAEVVSGPPGGSPIQPLAALDPARHWTIANTENLNAAARVRLAFGSDDGVDSIADARVAQASSAGGSFLTLGGTATGDPASGVVESTADLTPGAGFFTIGLEFPPVTWDGGASTTFWGDGANWNPDGVPTSSEDVSLSAASPTTIQVNGSFACDVLAIGDSIAVEFGSGSLDAGGAFTQLGGIVHLEAGVLRVSGSSLLSGGDLYTDSGELQAAGVMTISGGTAHLAGSGRLLAEGNLSLEGGAVVVGDGTIEMRGAFSRVAGSFDAGTGATVFSGSIPQSIGGGVTHHRLVLRGAGAKVFAAGAEFTVADDFTVESSAQVALSDTTPTTIAVGGDLQYGGLGGGSHVGRLTVNLTGAGKMIGGSAMKRAGSARLPGGITGVVLNHLTDPREISVETARDGTKSRSGLRNTYSQRAADVATLMAAAARDARVTLNLDDATLVRNPVGLGWLSPPAPFEMAVTVAAGASYSLEDDVTIGSGREFTVNGRLDCGSFALGGDGAVVVAPDGVLATATADTSGLAATVLAAGPNRYDDGAIIEYGAAGDQTINAANHPASAMIYTAGGGIKTLSGDMTITGGSGPALTKGALFVGPGTVFADGAHRLSFATSDFANVIVEGDYSSSGAGSLSYESGAYLSNILAADSTAFGDLFLNFDSSTQAVELNAADTVGVSFRNITFGGAAGGGAAGGTLRLNETGITNVTVTGGVMLSPAVAANTGGGFGGTVSTTGTVLVLGDIVSTSVEATQPILDGTGENTLVLGGTAGTQNLSLAASATLFPGSTLRVANASGVELAGAGLGYGIGGTLDLEGGNVTTGGNTLAIAGAGTLTRVSGHVVGNLRKNVGAGLGPAVTFEIGTGGDYTPVEAVFDTVSAGGELAATVAAADHPLLAASGLDVSKTANRTWTLTGPDLGFSGGNATFHFVPGDLDPGADPDSFMVVRRGPASWSFESVGVRTPAATQATGFAALGDFAVGQGDVFSITATAGPSGTVDPLGVVSLPAGSDSSFTMLPDPGYHVADVLVDSTSVGAVNLYTFSSIVSDHTIHATFEEDSDLVEARPLEGICISSATPCVEVPVMIERMTSTPLRSFSVTLQLGAGLELCSGPDTTNIVEGTYLSSYGVETAFYVVSNGGGSYTVDGSILGWPCGQTGDGTILSIFVASTAPGGTGTITITEVLLRDCVNGPILAWPGAVAAVEIDNTPPVAVSNVTAVQVKTGNDADGTTKISVTFTPPADAVEVEVYRAAFGNYPEYDDPPDAGSEPAAPAYPPGAPWLPTGVTASGQTDEPPMRGFWYYVAFAKDGCGNPSPVSARTPGTLNYHLGDVHDASVECAGDNAVSAADISFLSAHYGAALGEADTLGCLDVGPTQDLWVNARPLTDNWIQFEDLMMFAINYGALSKGMTKPPPAAVDELTLEAPGEVEEGAFVTAKIFARGTGLVQGLSVSLAWNAGVVEPVSMVPGDLIGPNGAVAFTPAPGTVDAAVLGVAQGGFTGEGYLAEVTFHAIAAGEPGFGIASVDARDEFNHTVAIGVVVGAPQPTPRVTALIGCAPNPFVPMTTVRYSLAQSGPVDLTVFSVDGRRVRTLASGVRPAGEHRVTWDGLDERGARVSSGVYFARFRAAGVTHTRSVTLLR